jgi:ABC-type nickel/cobalt efflux system permease component RcnA
MRNAEWRTEGRWWARLIVLLALVLVPYSAFRVPRCQAHPVPRSEHDRNVTVTWRPDGVHVLYRLEIDEYTLLTSVARWLADQPGDTRKPIGRKEIADEFIRVMKDLIPRNLIGKVDGKDIHFTCTEGKVEFLDSAQFRFKLKANVPVGPGRHTLAVEDTNFLDKKGRLAMKFEADPPLRVERVHEPPEAHVGEETSDDRLTVSATIVMSATGVELGPMPREFGVLLGPMPREVAEASTIAPDQPGPAPAEHPAQQAGFWDLLREVQNKDGLSVLLGTEIGLGMLLLVAFAHGVLHSLQPGHGKTMVAAYLVGEQGTPRHAVILGLIVTLTHTSAVYVVALLLRFVLPVSAAPTVQSVLGVGGGALVAFIGLWLLMARLGGRSDHVHFGSHSHSHGHGHAHGHSHGNGHAHSHGLTPEQFATVSWPRLVLLGISGGIIPCWGAILWVLYCVTAGRFGLALWAVLAFSVGLAVALVLIGLSVVWGGRAGGNRFRNRGWFQAVTRWLPVVGAATVIAIGLWLVKVNLPN